MQTAIDVSFVLHARDATMSSRRGDDYVRGYNAECEMRMLSLACLDGWDTI